jgi:phosphoenolpyruvate carboxykinase (GTP)
MTPSAGAVSEESQIPEIFDVDWRRHGDDVRFPWPASGENSGVLKWVMERVEGTAAVSTTPISLLRASGAFDAESEEWIPELPLIRERFDLSDVETRLPG